MPPRFDAENSLLEISVADLLEPIQARHLGFAHRGGYERMWVGQAIHNRYQEAAQLTDATYRKEVAQQVTLTHRGWEICIRGRVDGLREAEDGEGLVVEEIKSVRRGGQLAQATLELYQQQAALYGWMLDQQGETVTRCELVLIEIGSGQVEKVPVETDFQETGRLVRKRINRLIRSFEHRKIETERRRDAATRLTFPHPELRPGQDAIVERVARALDQREHLLLEAPTGVGKTVAALYPALTYALEHDKRVFVLTAKTLQQEMAIQVLDALNTEETYHSLRMRAKAKMCANEELICHEEFCPYAKGYYLKLYQTGVVANLLGSCRTLRPDAIFTEAKEKEVCPFEVSLELTGQSQVVVCDYNYAFDPYVSLRHFAADADLDDVILLIDEAHNLVDRGRGYYSPVLSSHAAEKAAHSLQHSPMPGSHAVAALCFRLAETIRLLTGQALEESGGGRAAETLFPSDQLLALRPEFDEAFVDYIDHQRSSSTYQAEDPFVSFYFDFLRFLDGLYLSSAEAFSHCVELEDGAALLKILCKDPSRFIGGVLNRTHSTIAFSATFSPPEFYRDLLGFDPERTDSARFPSPFPTEHRRIVIDSTVATTYREREANYAPIAERLSEMAESVPGNFLALFPSYAFLDEIAPRIQVRHRHLLVQQRANTDRERDEILDALRNPLQGEVLLLAVAGGVFAEGVDYPGEMLRAVAVVGPCLPAVTLEQELLKHYYQERFERGFEYAFVVPGMTRVIQAAGRLIRSADDTGVIALLDHRFLRPPYRHHLPPDWCDGPEELIGEPGRAAEEFFSDL